MPDLQPSEHHTDKYLQTTLEGEALQKRLFKIHGESKLFFEEQGYSILYLALGFLGWKESCDALEFRKAPLILVPVELERLSVGRPYRLKWTGDDVLTNISLRAKLTEQSVDLPEFEMPEDKQGIVDYFASVSTAVKKCSDWKILNDVCLDFFSFAKYIMFRDLEPKSWPAEFSPINNPLVKAILDPSSSEPGIPGFNEEEIDEKLGSKDIYHVMDADPSQIAVIEDIKAGRNLVVEGPPGTGKSQTITNAIAELIAAGKTVLFVSEKMAALRVVKDRLDKVGLGTFCLELHSNKTKKSEVLSELHRTANAQAGHDRPIDLHYEDHQRIRDNLNEYAAALRQPFHNTGLTPYEMLTEWITADKYFADVKRPAPEIAFSDLSTLTALQRAEAERTLLDLKDIVESLGDVTNSPWQGCSPPTILPGDDRQIDLSIKKLHESIEKVTSISAQIKDYCGVREAARVSDIDLSISAATIVAESQPVDRYVLINDTWNAPNNSATSLITDLQRFQAQRAELELSFQRKAFDLPVADILDEFRLHSAKMLRIFSARYRYLRKELRGWFNGNAPKKNYIIIAKLDLLAKNIQHASALAKKDDLGRSLFGSHWKGVDSDVTRLSDFSAWIVQYRRELLTGALSEVTNDVVSKGLNKPHLDNLIRLLAAAKVDFFATLEGLSHRIGLSIETAFKCTPEVLEFGILSHRCSRWQEELSMIQYWVKFRSVRQRCSPPIAAAVLAAVESGHIKNSADILPGLKAALSLALLRQAYSERTVLQEFIGDDHQKKIQRFHQLEELLMQSNQIRVRASVVSQMPKFFDGVSQNSQVGILIGEFKKKRRHLPIRKLMTIVGATIQRIKPCFMMSPLSIAQFLDPTALQFDVIIFDEASQVKPEDALGAMLRGKQLAVLGDTRQLPPTSFFSHMVNDDDEAEDEEQLSGASLVDMESILHRCSQCFPLRMLSWHYRSRHESLIAVSNYEFYDNKLLFFPSPTRDTSELGLRYVHTVGTVYDRGKSAMNRLEARMVAQEVVKHYMITKGDISLGVGTFSKSQKDAIDEEVELQQKLNPELDIYMNKKQFEGFFVKNLETIQGDERDVVFVSVGYGKTADGTLYNNFGPLGQEGGERRLNVLITRSRLRCSVFCNFRAEDMKLGGNEGLGVKALKSYLDFAESGKLKSRTNVRGDSESVFEDSVYEFLRSKGIDVHKQVGCSRYWIDLAVIDNNHPGRYVLGIECDGAQYHTSKVARERDRLREQVLKRLGWQVHRIWSTDWFRNRLATERVLLQAIESTKIAVANGHQEIAITTVDATQVKEVTEPALASRNGAITLTTSPAIKDEVPPYIACTDLGVVLRQELHEVPSHDIALAVKRVVEIEGPVHQDEVIARIRTLSGYARAGQRMKTAIETGIQFAITSGYVIKRKGFLWSAQESTIVARRRSSSVSLLSKYICDEELAATFKLVLSLQGATPEGDLIVQASRILGFQRTTAETEKHFSLFLHEMVKQGALLQNGAGQISNTQQRT